MQAASNDVAASTNCERQDSVGEERPLIRGVPVAGKSCGPRRR